MSTPYSICSLRAENLAGNYEPMHCDYPVHLLTRRTFALAAERILESRAVLPLQLGYGQPLGRGTRPPC